MIFEMLPGYGTSESKKFLKNLVCQKVNLTMPYFVDFQMEN